MQRQTAVTALWESKQLLLFALTCVGCMLSDEVRLSIRDVF